MKQYYETKCRRCAALHEWYFGDTGEPTGLNFNHYVKAMEDKTDSPRLMNCTVCQKLTVQDVVSYTRNIEQINQQLQQ